MRTEGQKVRVKTIHVALWGSTTWHKVSWYPNTASSDISAEIYKVLHLSPQSIFSLVDESDSINNDDSPTVVAISHNLPHDRKFRVLVHCNSVRTEKTIAPQQEDQGIFGPDLAIDASVEAVSKAFMTEEHNVELEESGIPLIGHGSINTNNGENVIFTSSSYSDNNRLRKKQHGHSPDWKYEDEDEMYSALLKIERVSSHLSNERTWLAWVRTTAAVISLGLAYLKLQVWDNDQSMPVYIIGSIIIASSLLTFALGADRYYKVKRALEATQPEGKLFCCLFDTGKSMPLSFLTHPLFYEILYSNNRMCTAQQAFSDWVSAAWW